MSGCLTCYRHHPDTVGLCADCTRALRATLNDLPVLWIQAHQCLLPGNAGKGSASGERTIGINITALDWINASDLIGVLHSWERLVREERHLTPPALIPAQATIGAEIITTVTFLARHLDWISTQGWADEFAHEIDALHAQGCVAARRQREATTRIRCPHEHPDGTLCAASLPLHPDDLFEPIICKRCRSQWTTIRLVAVALSDRSRSFWLDADAIATWLGITPRHVRRLAKAGKAQRKGQLLNVHDILDAAKVAA